MQRLMVGLVVALLVVECGWQLSHSCLADELRIRSRSSWSGDSGAPRQTWQPGMEQKETQFQQRLLDRWQRAEQQSASTRVTPENYLRSLQNQIQQAQRSNDFGAIAAGYARLADGLRSGGLAPYAPQLNAWDCNKKEIEARQLHIKQLHRRGDFATEGTEWRNVNALAARLNSHEPGNAQWSYLEGISFYKIGPDFYSNAKEWLTKCMRNPACQPGMKIECNSTIAAIKLEEQRAAAIAAAEAKQREASYAAARQSSAKDRAERLLAEGQHLADEAEFDRAISKVRESISVYPSNSDAYVKLGMFLVYKGDNAQSEQAFRTAVKINPKDAYAWFNLGAALVNQRREAEAREAYKKARDLHDPKLEKLIDSQLAALGK
jgi:tetratricopeptide (TPR) repeat protein